ncbi:hypothetical protein IQ07DRAFT_109623 [Pyrenochaeta sp. DS3sAY3a]|nr:hypothetical protein IQ07DRAFT_109623 [Pyrenochaeta sp. DS3sAY3a]
MQGFESDGLSNQTTSQLNSTITQWLNVTSTKPPVVNTTTKALGYSASWASKCTVEQYPTDFPVAYYPENLECGIPWQDTWERDEYQDRCLARWCSMSLWDLETRIQATYVPTFTVGTFVDQASWLSTVYKTTLTASDESPIDYYVYMSEEAFTYTLEDVANPISALLVPNRPCCGQCSIQVDQLHIFYWPDFAGEWGSVTSFPSLSIPTGTGKFIQPITRIIVTEVDTYIETVNGEVITRLSTVNPDEIVYVVNGTSITSLGGDPRTRTSIQKREIDGNPSVVSIVDENGFTFISPSVYIAFTSLAATDSCGPVGNVPVTTTLALNPDEISTLSYLAHTDKFCGYLTFTKPMTWSDLLRDCATIRPGLVYNPDWTDNWRFTEDRCHP